MIYDSEDLLVTSIRRSQLRIHLTTFDGDIVIYYSRTIVVDHEVTF